MPFFGLKKIFVKIKGKKASLQVFSPQLCINDFCRKRVLLSASFRTSQGLPGSMTVEAAMGTEYLERCFFTFYFDKNFFQSEKGHGSLPPFPEDGIGFSFTPSSVLFNIPFLPGQPWDTLFLL